jgi:alanine racemase
MYFIRPTHAKINLSNLVHNFNLIKNKAKKSTKIISVIKANAYGHGAIECGKALVKAGTDYLGVATIEEGIELRNAGIKIPILVLGSVYPYESFEYIIKYKLTPTISSVGLARKLSNYCKNLNKKIMIHIKVDTGMGRIGMSISRAKQYIENISKLNFVKIEGVYTHFAGGASNINQINSFNTLKNSLAHLNIPYFHAANSLGFLKYSETEYNMIRPGIALYGLIDGNYKFKPVLSLKSKIVFLKTMPQGKGISYGHIYKTYKQTIVATVPIGYADGYNRLLSNSIEGIVKGVRVPQIGRICMDMCMFDVTNVKNVKVGDEIVLIGNSGKEIIKVEDIAKQIGSITYEVVCQISSRVPRIY